jgi:predicted dehydrogenase
MGYQNRFHPCISDVRSALNDGSLGKVISVDNEFSERLTTMHRYEDYKDTYMARKDMGGGPVLNLQIHCLDYLQILFGTPVDVYSLCRTQSGLSVDVEDTAGSLYRFEGNDGRMITVYSHTDFLQFPPVHRLKVVCEKGRIEADFNAAVTNIYAGDEPVRTITHEGFVRNDMFIEELKEFAECIKEKKTPSSSLDAGITGLKMALAAKKSSAENRAVRIEEIKLS